MIHVDRDRQEAGQAIKPADSWFEDARERTNTAIEEGADHEVTDLYKHAEVKMALEKLFHDKCAYCECRPSAGNSWDVEHYRPKGRVAERPDDHPGYYWLAYVWDNLLPSCSLCNQKRKDQPRFGDPVTLPAQGKLDQFPVEKEEDRAMTPDHDLTKERPYLLNPCCEDDKPEEHLTYDFFGRIHPVQEDDDRVSETIRICNLTRRRLKDDRAREIRRISKAMRNRGVAVDEENALAVELLDDLIETMVADKALYAGAARYVRRNPDEFITELPE